MTEYSSTPDSSSPSLPDPVPAAEPRRRRIAVFLRVSALNLAAGGGAVCIVAVICALLFDITLILFKTGSMSPAIPAGSIAVVRVIPAGEVTIGDVLTVDRPGRLPITHRVQSVQTAPNGHREITMKGDANPTADPAPYIIAEARLVMVSVPHIAYPLAAMSNPVALGSVTVGVAVLVTWTLWPRSGVGRNSP